MGHDGYAPLFKELGYGTTIWSPLASGLLTGKYNAGIPKGSRLDLPNMKWLAEMVMNEERIGRVRALEPVSKELGCSMAQLALAWCLKNPHVSSVITGASRKEQVVENMKALEVVPRLTPDVMKRLETILDNAPKD